MGESKRGGSGAPSLLIFVLRSKSRRNNTKKRTTDRKVVQKLGTKKSVVQEGDFFLNLVHSGFCVIRIFNCSERKSPFHQRHLLPFPFIFYRIGNATGVDAGLRVNDTIAFSSSANKIKCFLVPLERNLRVSMGTDAAVFLNTKQSSPFAHNTKTHRTIGTSHTYDRIRFATRSRTLNSAPCNPHHTRRRRRRGRARRSTRPTGHHHKRDAGSVVHKRVQDGVNVRHGRRKIKNCLMASLAIGLGCTVRR